MSIYLTIKCDQPGCEKRYVSFTHNRSRLIMFARMDNWQIGSKKHYCPDHRTTEARKEITSMK